MAIPLRVRKHAESELPRILRALRWWPRPGGLGDPAVALTAFDSRGNRVGLTNVGGPSCPATRRRACAAPLGCRTQERSRRMTATEFDPAAPETRLGALMAGLLTAVRRPTGIGTSPPTFAPRRAIISPARCGVRAGGRGGAACIPILTHLRGPSRRAVVLRVGSVSSSITVPPLLAERTRSLTRDNGSLGLETQKGTLVPAIAGGFPPSHRHPLAILVNNHGSLGYTTVRRTIW